MSHAHEGCIPGISSLLLNPRALLIGVREFDPLDSAGNPQNSALFLNPAAVGTRLRSQLMIDMTTRDFTSMNTCVALCRSQQGHAVGATRDCDQPAVTDRRVSQPRSVDRVD